MDTKSTGVGLVCIPLLAVVLGLAVYPLLPLEVASHWDSMGQVTGYMPKFWGVFVFPWVMFALFILWLAIPAMEPLKKNLDAFRPSYNGFFLVLSVFFFYLFALMIGANSGWDFNFNQALSPALALLLAAIALLLEHSKRNYFVGIRTPWTLSSDKVWKRTHLLGAKLFFFCAAWALAGVSFPEYLVVFICAPLLVAIAVTVVYSYIEFKRA